MNVRRPAARRFVRRLSGYPPSNAGTHAVGCVISIVLGFIGALVGIWLARLTGLPEIFAVEIGGARIPIVWTIIGGAIFCGLLQFLRRRP